MPGLCACGPRMGLPVRLCCAGGVMRHRMTRKEEVVNRLITANGAWVDGTELATFFCGGSEGLRRVREARADGWPIEERRHPNKLRMTRQYRIVLDDATYRPIPRSEFPRHSLYGWEHSPDARD